MNSKALATNVAVVVGGVLLAGWVIKSFRKSVPFIQTAHLGFAENTL